MLRRTPDSVPTDLHIVTNWFLELERLVPIGD